MNSALINQFGNLENILNKTDKIEKPSIRSSITTNIERLRNNYKLIKFEQKATLLFVINELNYIYSGATTNEVLKGIGLK